jgi:antitoxin MazE
MKTQIVTIGNSQGIRIPKLLLEQSSLESEVELEVCNDGILIRPAKRIRDGWDAEFKLMSESDDDELIDDDLHTAFDRKKWQW